MNLKRIFLPLILTACFLSACLPAQAEEVEDADPTLAEPEENVSLWLPPYLPDAFVDAVNLPADLEMSSESDDLSVDVGGDNLVSEWIYVLAAPFPTIQEGIGASELEFFWKGNEITELPFNELLVSGDTRAVFEKIWGPPSMDRVINIPEAQILASAWEGEGAWALIPFEDLDPRWKVISLGGQNPLDDDFDAGLYSLNIPFSLVGDAANLQAFNSAAAGNDFAELFPSSNRYGDRLTHVLLTGVTALVRATASTMERNGMTYPAIDIGGLLRDADILHINNEIAFSQSCPKAGLNKGNEASLIFCSRPEYIQLLESIGTDVIEMTGDHFRDRSSEDVLYTIDMYDERGWPHYGGGRNLEDALQPALFEHNGNRIAFLGCNAKDPWYALADEDTPGALFCDMGLMIEEIGNVADKGYLPIFTFQHQEYYSYEINEVLSRDFQAVADAGAVVVSGSQAHMPHGIEFYRDAILHYGLGNLFFDQYNESAAQREAVIDEHIFHDGRHIGTRLITIQFVDYARPRLMTETEREALLNKIFNASDW